MARYLTSYFGPIMLLQTGEQCACHITLWPKISPKAQVTSRRPGASQKQAAIYSRLIVNHGL